MSRVDWRRIVRSAKASSSVAMSKGVMTPNKIIDKAQYMSENEYTGAMF